MAILCMCFMCCLASRWGVLNFYRVTSDCLYKAPRTLVVTVLKGLRFHPTILNV